MDPAVRGFMYSVRNNNEEIHSPLELSEDNPVVLTYKSCMLPADERRLKDEIDEEAMDGFESDDECELCRLPDETANHFPESLQEFYNFTDTQSKKLPSKDFYKNSATKFNSVCYDLDQNLGRPAKIRKITGSHVRKHYEETEHLSERSIDLVTREIWYIIQCKKHMRQSQMWKEEYKDGVSTGHTYPDTSGHLLYSRLDARLEKNLLLRMKLEMAEEVKKQGRTRSSQKPCEAVLTFNSY